MMSGIGSNNQSVRICRSLVISPINSMFQHLVVRRSGILVTACNVNAVAMGEQANILMQTNVDKRHMKRARYVQCTICHRLEVMPVILPF